MTGHLSSDRQGHSQPTRRSAGLSDGSSLESPPGRGPVHELAGDPRYAFFTSSIIADFGMGYEPPVRDQVMVARSQEASGMTGEMPSDGG